MSISLKLVSMMLAMSALIACSNAALEYSGPNGGSRGGAPSEFSDVDYFELTLYPSLRNACVACHANPPAGVPAFAADDVALAFEDIVAYRLVNLLDPMQSRIVSRMWVDRHNCGIECDFWAEEFMEAIYEWEDLSRRPSRD